MIDVGERAGVVRVVVETPAEQMGCCLCGVIATSHGRRDVHLIDVPGFGRPVGLVWRKRTWRGGQDKCLAGSFTEQQEDVARPRVLLPTRACWWAIGQLRREQASVAGLARQLGTTWRNVWRSIKPLLQAMGVRWLPTRVGSRTLTLSGSTSTSDTTSRPRSSARVARAPRS